MTAGGHFPRVAAADVVDSDVYENRAGCPAGGVTQLTAAHGNHAVYACSSGQSYLRGR